VSVASQDGVTWADGTTEIAPQSMFGVTFGNNKYVAVGGSKAIYSFNGTSWIDSNDPTISGLLKVVYGSFGNYLAISYGTDDYFTSNDGETWTLRTMPSSSTWFSISYVNNKFIALSMDKVAISEDATSWTEVSIGGRGLLPFGQNTVYGNGKYVTIDGYASSASSKSVSSTNGTVWNYSSISSSYFQSGTKDIAFGNNKFIIVGSGPKFVHSTNGTTWTEGDMPSNSSWHKVIFSDNKFVAFVASGDTIAVSYDGLIWSEHTLPVSSNWNAITYGCVTNPPSCDFLAISYGNQIAISTDGSTWTDETVSGSYDWISLTYGDDKFVAVAVGSNKSIYSADGVNWYINDLPASLNWYSIAYGNSKFVAIAYNTDIYATSPDAINWTQRSISSSAYWHQFPTSITCLSLWVAM
jgi:hypothetical protein